jgi:protein O-GlcNAc transferase
MKNNTPSVAVLEAQNLLQRGQLEPALKLVQRALAQQPQSALLHDLLAIIAILQKRPADAVAHATQAVQWAPDNAQLLFTLGRALKASGELAAAVATYRRVIAMQPQFAEAFVSLGISLRALGELDEAIRCQERAIQLKPGLAVAHANLSNALAARAERDLQQGLEEPPNEEALARQKHAVALDPKNAVLHRNLGVLLIQARQRLEAAQAFNQALTLDPSDVEACLRLSHCLKTLGDSKLARAACEKWLSINPPNAPVMRALAALLTRDGQVDLGLDWAQKATTLDPDANALAQLGNTLMQARRLPEALVQCRAAVDAASHRFDLFPSLLLGSNYLHEDPQHIADVHVEFGRRLPPAADRPLWQAKPAGTRLKVGYVSGDFVRHSVSFFIGALLERHDKSRFDVTCYHNLAWGDAVTERLKSCGHAWVECEGLSDEQLRRRVVADGVDILVDLSGHTTHSRVFMFGLGAAPVQVAYLGYPTASGVPQIDFRISDKTIDPGDMPALPGEQALPLPRSMFCYRPDEHTAIAGPPSERKGWITFGSFNNIAKVNDHTLELWAQAMNAVPGSRLLLKSSAMAQANNRSNIEAFMAARGVAAERLQLQAWVSDKSTHLALYNEVDIALDPFPYNGATTTCEALWMGVPVVSLRGRTHTSRMGASLLQAIGKPEWVTHNDTDHVNTLVRLAADLPARAAWRTDARKQLQASELMDEAGFTHAFEAALVQAWVRKGQPVVQSAMPAQAQNSDQVAWYRPEAAALGPFLRAE